MLIAHSRKRHCMTLLMQKIKFAPVVSIQGARPCTSIEVSDKISDKKHALVDLKSTSASQFLSMIESMLTLYWK